MNIKVGAMTADGTVEVVLDGWLDTKNAPELAKVLSELDPGAKRLVLDAQKLQYISSAGIRQVVAAQKLMRGAMTLRHPSEDVLGVLRLVGLDRHLDIER